MRFSVTFRRPDNNNKNKQQISTKTFFNQAEIKGGAQKAAAIGSSAVPFLFYAREDEIWWYTETYIGIKTIQYTSHCQSNILNGRKKNVAF